MVDSLAARGRSHTHLRELLDARDPLLHGREREQLLDTADALLFGEPEADEKLTAAHLLLDEMVESGRWVQGPADEVFAALEGCRGELAESR
jgi:hypothetical protein